MEGDGAGRIYSNLEMLCKSRNICFVFKKTTKLYPISLGTGDHAPTFVILFNAGDLFQRVGGLQIEFEHVTLRVWSQEMVCREGLRANQEL